MAAILRIGTKEEGQPTSLAGEAGRLALWQFGALPVELLVDEAVGLMAVPVAQGDGAGDGPALADE